MTREEALALIESLDHYFRDCEAGGHGINSKESVAMLKAMETAMDKGSSPLDINAMIASETARSILARTPVMAGMRELLGC